MALRGPWAVLYYGILASVTGGWLPVRAKNPWLVIFHLYLFLTFVLFPLVVYLIDAMHWAGWMVYSLFILFSFLLLKVYNLRLHKSLGEDPVPEPEPEEEEEEGEKEGEEKETDDKEMTDAEKEKRREAEAEIEATVTTTLDTHVDSEIEIAPEGLQESCDFQEESPDLGEESLRKHRDSASTFGRSSSFTGTAFSQSVELQLVSTSEGSGKEVGEAVDTAVVVEVSKEEKKEVPTTSPELSLGSDPSPPLDAINEEGEWPIHLPTLESTREPQASSHPKAPVFSVPGTVEAPPILQPPPLRSTITSLNLSPTPSLELLEEMEQPPTEPEVELELPQEASSFSQPSVLMSPVHRSRTDMQASGNIENYINVLSSFSQPTEEDERGSAPASLQRSSSMPPSVFENERGSNRRDRVRVCIRQNRGVESVRRHERRRFGHSMSEDQITGQEEGEGGEMSSSIEQTYPPQSHHRRRYAVRSRRVQSADPSLRFGRPPSPPQGATASTRSFEDPLLRSVKTKLLEDGHLALLDVAVKMPTEMQEAVLVDSIPASCYENISSRVGQLHRGHLASGDMDSSLGAVHWFEVSGEWDFYVFHPDGEEEEEEPSLPHVPDSHTPDDLLEGLDRLRQEMLLHYGLDIDDLAPHPHPPPPPPRPHVGSGGGEGEGEEEPKPTFEVVPGVQKTTVTLDFERRQLEEFMDRNVTWIEALVTVFLATLVCVIAALLLMIGFYSDFWVFWFCFVVGTAHFSLIKSVQDDPASPSPGQNHITALSRACYFVVVGVLALIITAALDGEDFSPLCVYGFDVNNRSVLMFVRNGLLIFILFFPVLFTLGLLPQADTFTIYLLEQIDIHIFGGTAATGLVCAFYAIGRSLAVGALLWPLGYAAFSTLESDQPKLTCSSTGFDPNDPGSCMVNDRVALSFFLGLLFAFSFALSRSTSNHQYIRDLLLRMMRKCKNHFLKKPSSQSNAAVDLADPLEEIYCMILCKRMLSDLLASLFIFVFVTGLNLTTIFCLSIIPAYVIYGITSVLGVVNHYLLPHIRKEMPWICCSEPLVKAREWDTFEVSETPPVSPIERVLQLTLFLERNIFYPLAFLFALNLSAPHYQARFGDFGAALVVTVVGMKLLRSAYTEISRQHIVLIFTLFFFNFDYEHLSEGLPLNYFIMAILFNKFFDLLLKMYFIFIYIAPWQPSWSSPGHIIVQPLLIPHTPIIFFQTLIASIVNAPINPLVASTLFTLSYARPIKYWEKDYNTKRADSSNTRLDSQLESNLRNPNPDRLDSLFYEHLTWVLQKSLCGDLMLGRWGRVTSGDFFILTSDRLNALVHIIEIGNGFVTFQLRGLEFRGTYCQQREVEAITETVADDEGCCCYEPGHLPYTLSCNKALSLRWLAWEVVSSCYTIHGYSISENQAHLVFNSYDYKKGYISYYCKCIIYKLIQLPHLQSLLLSEQLHEALQQQHAPTYVDMDALFDETRNSDYSHAAGGISRERFADIFMPFIRVCVEQREGVEVDPFLVTLCFAYTLLGRRMFLQHAQAGAGRRSGDNFMNGLYRMFLGDARPNSTNDEWVFLDVDTIQEIIIPAARIALKVHQDNFTFSEDYESPMGIYEVIQDVEENHVVTHENDRAWRNAVVMNKPSLLALRYQRTEDSYIYPYKLIRLTSKFIKFRVIKVNRECVRSLWTSQQHELIFLRNSDSERGSIQNHKPTLRNIVNSSMDLPIGYPIYVSPLQTSYIDRHETYNSTSLGKMTNPLEFAKAFHVLRKLCEGCIQRYRGSRGQPSAKNTPSVPPQMEGTGETQVQRSGSVDSLTGMQYGTETGNTQAYEDPFPDSDSDSDELLWKPMWVSKMVVIVDDSQVFETFNVGWLKWPDVKLARKASKAHWKAWRPREGMEGEVVHEWRPFHRDPVQRSHIDKVILLVKTTEDCYVLIKEQGVKEV